MNLTPQQQFFVDLFTRDGRPYPGHGVRVNAESPYDQQVLRHGTLEDRARMGQAVLQHDLEWLEVVGDDRVPMLHCWTGTEIFAAAFGSPVHLPADSMPFALPAVSTPDDADQLVEPDIHAGSLGDMFNLCDRMVALCGDQYPVRICDIQSPFDIAALIWDKESFFEALIDYPDAVHRLLRKVTNTMIRFIAAFRQRYRHPCLVHHPELWQPPEWGICLSEDDIGSISPAHFRTFCLPYLRELDETFGGMSIHSCAASQLHWDSLLTLPNLHYINLHNPPTTLRGSIDAFSSIAVLAPGAANFHEVYLDFVQECLALSRPDTRWFFNTGADDRAQARALTRQIKRLCRRL